MFAVAAAAVEIPAEAMRPWTESLLLLLLLLLAMALPSRLLPSS
jgi:hypothetical protein